MCEAHFTLAKPIYRGAAISHLRSKYFTLRSNTFDASPQAASINSEFRIPHSELNQVPNEIKFRIEKTVPPLRAGTALD